LQVASSLARAMVTRWGMSDSIGPVALENDGGRAMFGQGVESKEYSEKTSALIDSEVQRIMNESNDARSRSAHYLQKRLGNHHQKTDGCRNT